MPFQFFSGRPLLSLFPVDAYNKLHNATRTRFGWRIIYLDHQLGFHIIVPAGPFCSCSTVAQNTFLIIFKVFFFFKKCTLQMYSPFGTHRPDNGRKIYVEYPVESINLFTICVSVRDNLKIFVNKTYAHNTTLLK